jgi:chemotaxis protein CheC
MIPLNADQIDALVEIFNISIGRAAASLSSMVEEEVTLTVPSIEFMAVKDAAQRLGIDTQRICGVIQSFDGPFHAEAMLMFPEDRSLEIVRMMLGESYSLDELSDLQQEAMSEIGNILLNACVGSIANITHASFDSTLPEVRMGLGQDLLQSHKKTEQDSVLLIYIDFIIAARTIHGYMAFLMDVPSINGLIESVDRFLTSDA